MSAPPLAPSHLRPPPLPSPLDTTSNHISLSSLPLCLQPHRLPLPSLLKSCALHRNVSLGQQLHALSVKLGRSSSDQFVQSSLVSFYSSCSLHDVALQLFDENPQPNVVSYTSAMDACLKSDKPELAFALFNQMLVSGLCQTSLNCFELSIIRIHVLIRL